MKTLLIAGANGFLARHLTQYFSSHGWEVVGLARREQGVHPRCRYVHWDGQSIGPWAKELESCDAVVNLVGKSVNCRFTPENRELIMKSRIESTRVIGEAIAVCDRPPAVWLNASGANFYSSSHEHGHNEGGEKGEGFMTDVVEAWEERLFDADVPQQVRRVALRTSMVLADVAGNPLRIFRTLAKLGMGGKIGSGNQRVSWIHIDDVCGVIAWIIEHENLTGPVNMTSPEPLTHRDFMCRFRKSVGMPVGLPAAAWMVKLAAYFLRIAPGLILDSLWVLPGKMLESGYVYKHPKMNPRGW
ncbi:MAG: TIGR01777 family oxidoreductase [Verrucomicrobiae bacterium]|nr:TIGR01777 family oxidoreductase [Verrucomicrobiae bacterium]NNJ41859.1 TIGR01777 family protein [Akkermansiaceae bacterium]